MKSPVLFVLLDRFAVRDGRFVTVNGSAPPEFSSERLAALDAYPAECIVGHYQFFKQRHVAIS